MILRWTPLTTREVLVRVFLASRQQAGLSKQSSSELLDNDGWDDVLEDIASSHTHLFGFHETLGSKHCPPL